MSEIIGLKKQSKDGFIAECVQHYNYNKNLIRFEDGTTKYVSTYRFQNSDFLKAKTSFSHSMNEIACFYYLQQLGFLIPTYNDMYCLGFSNRMLFDMYNPRYRIAIEYDGFGHNNKRDCKKNKLCKEKGINIIRLREKSCEKLEDDISLNYNELPASWFSPQLESTLKIIINNIIEEYNIPIIVSVDFSTDKGKIKELYYKITNKDKPTKYYYKRERDRRDKKVLNKSKKQYKKDIIAYQILRNPNIKYRDIASKFQVSESTVRKIAKDYGIKRYKRR